MVNIISDFYEFIITRSKNGLAFSMELNEIISKPVHNRFQSHRK